MREKFKFEWIVNDEMALLCFCTASGFRDFVNCKMMSGN